MDGSRDACESAARPSSPSSTRCTSVPPCGGMVVMLPLIPRLSRLSGERVQPAFGLATAAPPSRPLRLAGRGGPGARPATDAGVTPVGHREVGSAVLADVAPHVGQAPPADREAFDAG